MKRMLCLLLALGVSFVSVAQKLQLTKAKVKRKAIYSSALLTPPEVFAKMTSGLSVQQLWMTYDKSLWIKKIIRNSYNSAHPDTLLCVDTKADKLEVLRSDSNAFLLKADITSRRVAFGYDMRIGTSKVTFCRLLKVPATYDRYRFGDECTTLLFTFRQGVLADVSYQGIDCN